LTTTDLLLAILPALRQASISLNEPYYETVAEELINKFGIQYVKKRFVTEALL